jgi:D-alanine-D-alanine ligase-like ATP-grasp enzyme
MLWDYLGLCDLCRFDFLVSDGEVLFIEITPFPGMTTTSLYPALTESMGLNKGEFINLLIEEKINAGHT